MNKIESPAASILLYSGWQTCNIGDIGHTPGTLAYLEKFLPKAKVTLWLLRGNEEVVGMLNARFPRVKIVQGEVNAEGRASTPELQKALDESEVVIYNSGMHFNKFWPSPIRVLNVFHTLKKHVVLYGHSFDGFREEELAAHLEAFSKCALIYCRDNESLAYLRKENLSARVLEFGPDGCFGSDVRDEARAISYLKENGLEDRKFITVTIRTNTPKSGSREAGDVLNPKVRSPELVAQDELWAEKLRHLIATWVKSTGKKVLLTPEVDKEIGPALELLWKRLPADIQKKVVHRNTFWNCDEAASIFARAHTVVCMEPHSCILAMAAGTPVIHLASLKHGIKAWMFRDIGLPEWLYDIDQEKPEQFSNALLRIEADYPLALEKVRRSMRFVNDRSAEMMGEIGTLFLTD
ncbi:MAG: polysaccharide pyruvyl transferase family protein [Spirochaetia bacterium]|nr:polysaccharide pyruvyl transferase family protein [Spirochaetia bacterium]